MKVWQPKSTNPPTLLAISWFWVFFWRTFNENDCLGNKRSTKCWLKLFSSKRSHFKLQKRYLWFFYTTQTFFNIFTFMFDERTVWFRKFNVHLEITVSIIQVWCLNMKKAPKQIPLSIFYDCFECISFSMGILHFLRRYC